MLVIISVRALPGQQRVTLEASDGLIVVADSYLVNDTLPWVLMYHQSGSSRGEFREIAPRFNTLGYNALAVDLRNGREVNFIINETARAARDGNFRNSMQEAFSDVIASIQWAEQQNEKPLILLGSSYSASLALMAAGKSSHIKAVIAFSPGEFFGQRKFVQESLKGLEKPVFIAATERERSYATTLVSEIAGIYKTIFSPARCAGVHGARALWETEECNDEYWLALLLFLNNLKSD